MCDCANLSLLYSVISEVGTWQVVTLLQLLRLRKGKVSPESKDGVVCVYRVPQKPLNTTSYKLIELYGLITFIYWLPEMFKVSSSLPKGRAYCFTKKTELWYVPLDVVAASSVKWFLHHTAIVYVIQVCWQLARKQSAHLYDIYHCCVYSEKCWWWTQDLSETCRVLFQK